MTHTNYPRLPDAFDHAPHRFGTLANTVVFAFAAVISIVVTAVVATFLVPLAPGVGLLVALAGFPISFLVATVALHAGLLKFVRTGIPADARALLRRGRGHEAVRSGRDTVPRRMTDGGHPDWDGADDC